METDCVLCEVRSKTQETVNDLKITTETVSVLCEVRSGDEYTADDLSKPIEQARQIRLLLRVEENFQGNNRANMPDVLHTIYLS